MNCFVACFVDLFWILIFGVCVGVKCDFFGAVCNRISQTK